MATMDNDRKYKQRGYQESERDNHSQNGNSQRPQGQRLPLDVTGPRLPRMVQSVTAIRCWNCATTIPDGVDFSGNCPKCNSPLHCCKQCAHFEPSTRFQCLKPIPARIAYKDQANECGLFSSRVTVARDSAAPSSNAGQGSQGNNPSAPRQVERGNSSDARTAFDNLFKK
jgi:hypothetical protein